MKRRFALIFLICFLVTQTAIAETEITFQGIPWLSNEKILIDKLNEFGITTSFTQLSMKQDRDAFLIIEDDTGFISPDHAFGADDVLYSLSVTGPMKGKMGGYPLKDLKFTLTQDGDFYLLAAQVNLVGATYQDIKKNLTEVYGETTEITTEEEIRYCVWKGDKNSCVLLFTYGNDYTLIYGRLDALNILKKCLNRNDPDNLNF